MRPAGEAGANCRADKAQYPQCGTKNVLLEIFRPAPTGGGTAPTARLRAQHSAVTGRQGRCELPRRPACAGGRPPGTAWTDSRSRIPASIVCTVPPRSPRQVRFVLGVRLRCARRQSAVPQCEKEIAVFSIFLPAPSGSGPAFGRMRFAQGVLLQHSGRHSGCCSAARPKGGGRPPGTAWKNSRSRIPAFIIFAAAPRSPRQTRLASVIRSSALSPMGAFA